MRSFTFTTKDGVSLWACAWEAEEPKAALCIVHGLGEHAGRYEKMALILKEKGISVYAYDQRGHGHSPGKRAVARLETLSQDAQAFTDKIEKESGLPTFLFGHSMGGGVGLYTLLFHTPKIRGAIITSPWLRLVSPPPKPLLAIVHALPFVFKNVNMSNGIGGGQLCHDDEVGGAYALDELNHSMVGLSLGADMMYGGERTIREAGTLSVPLLLLHGDCDPICSIEGSRAFAKGAGDKCRLVEFKDMFHELHNEPAVRDQVFDLEAEFVQSLL